MRKTTKVQLVGAILILVLGFISSDLNSQCNPGTIEGQVFLDADFNGTKDNTEEGLSGIIVRAYNTAGISMAQAISANNGSYTLQGLNDGDEYRVLFTIPENMYVSAIGPDNQSEVQFVTVPNCKSNLGINDTKSDCTSDSELFLTCFVNGLGANSPQQETVIGLTHDFNATSDVNVYARQEETGAVYGLSYKSTTKEIFSAAYIKQHASLTTHGHDAIFTTNINGQPTTTLFTKLSDLGLETGILNETNSDNCAYGAQVGKIGLGALELDADQKFMYVTNLYTKSVVKIDTENPTPATTQSFQVPNPSCNFNDYAVFALKYYKGDLYVGVTCTAETTKDIADGGFHVFKMNTTSGNFNLIFSTNYLKGIWKNHNYNAVKAQWLKDIEFTDEGNMVLGIADKVGDTYCNTSTSRVDDQYGDILMVYDNNGVWTLENNGATNDLVGSGVGNGEGPGGGEFFGDDHFPKDPVDHPDVILGSLYAMPGTGEIVAAVYDPLFNTYSGGIHKYNTSNGKKVSAKELYNHNISNYFGKATGFGDLTTQCGVLTVEIGNYVWIDENKNGIQDAGEAPMTGLPLVICDANCEPVGYTTTDADGNYRFNETNVDLDGDGTMDGLAANQTYYISIDPALFEESSQSYKIGDTYYYPTVNSTEKDINSNLVVGLNPCETTNGKTVPMVEVTTTPGNNTTFDIGMTASDDFDLALRKTTTHTNGLKIGDDISFQFEIFNQGGIAASEYTIVDYITDAYTFDPNQNPGWTMTDGKLYKTTSKTIIPGKSTTESLVLQTAGNLNNADFVNVAEIVSARDINGVIATDTDSEGDDIKNNDSGGEVGTANDDRIDGDMTTDEDDHDPAKVNVFDLALKNIIADDRTYDMDDIVTFEMTVYNQGNVTATSLTVTNYFPENLEFVESMNNSWIDNDNGTASYVYNQELEPNHSIKLMIHFKLVDDNAFNDILNVAEISAFTTAENITVDYDSVADADPDNDNGGNVYDNTNDMVNDHGLQDEDDHDPALVKVRKVDLALMKTAKTKVYQAGQEAEFIIEVVNQGDMIVKSVVLVDYLPENATLTDNSWVIDGGDPTGRTASKQVVFPGGLNPGAKHKESIFMTIDQNETKGLVINEAEIAQIIDVNGMDISDKDIDSHADMDKDNDAGGGLGTSVDDYLDGNGIDDEDDHDPAGLYIATIEIEGTCECNNDATNPFDGTFEEVILVTAPPGQTWMEDFSVNINLYNLVETNIDANTSEYRFYGIIVDDTPYSLRVFNEDGAYLQISGGGELCSYNDTQITSPTNGLSGVCSNALHTYVVEDMVDCDDFTWTLSGGGSIVGPIDQQSVQVQWGANGGPYTLEVIPDCPDACLSPVSTDINVGQGNGAMACRLGINVSLSNDCATEVKANMILTSPMMAGVVYQVMVTDKHGHVVPNNLLNEDHLWTTVTAKVIDPCTGNSCWSPINVEDKMPPIIQCGDIELPCWQMDSYEPIVYDNCTLAEYELISETIEPLICNDDYIKEVYRTYIATDEYGNESQPCTQRILLERIDLDGVIFPEDFTLIDTTNLSCSDTLYDETGFPRISITGVPTLEGGALFPVPDFYCNIGVDYEDFLVADFGCVRKIMRTWTVYEAWCTVGELRQYTQTIEIVDTFSPEVDCPDDFTVSSDGGLSCSATVLLELPEITDDCSTEFEIDISYNGGFLDNRTTAETVTLDAGVNEILYTVYDGCENSSTCTTNITVLDEANPTAVCDENTVVSLRSDGTAKAFAHTFDDGSFDDCSLFTMLVRRMNPQCDCHVPVYDNMRYLGSLNGRYYYLSDYKTHGFKAFSYSTAFGGFLLTLESEEEDDWVYDKVSQYISGLYYIGLSDENHNPGDFRWANHAIPGYTNWAAGEPDTSGHNVVVNANGEWEDVNGNSTEAYFVMEVADPCTFSDEVHFCCADVAEDQMVVFRAVDYFGRYNECMVVVDVQDKVPPKIDCPDDFTIQCDYPYVLEDLSEFGTATATDQCFVEITESVSDTINSCKVGQIDRTFTAADQNGSSECTQTIFVVNDNPFDSDSIVWPMDFTSDEGCNTGSLHPDNLDEEFGYPQYEIGPCDLIAPSFDDQTYSFVGTGSDACLKLLRTWTVVDWCQMDADPNYEPAVYQQTIKIRDLEGPTIESGCDTLKVVTQECDSTDIAFTVIADDSCTPLDDLENSIQIDIDGDGDFDFEDSNFGNVVSFSGRIPIGNHFALISFSDMCGNTTTCAKIIEIATNKPPTAACKDGLSVGLVPMDLDDDGVPDTEMTCIFPYMVDASSTHTCGFEINLSFSSDSTDNKLIFDCFDLGIQIVELWVTDEFGNQDLCTTHVEVQDNNNVDFCPRFDLALRKTFDAASSDSPVMPGSDVTFDIEVFNQGNISAYNIELVDYVPDGMTLNDANWTQTGDMAILNNPIAFLEDSTSTTVSISFIIDSDYMGFTIENAAEIKAADNDTDPNNEVFIDGDSDPDMINDDNVVNDVIDNSGNDEDDHDIEVIDVEQIFDLSLIKSISTSTPGPFTPGSPITFDLTVTNEGTLDATNVIIGDNLPDDVDLIDPEWSYNGPLVTNNTPIPLIEVGSSVTIQLMCEIEPGYQGASFINYAQIVDDGTDLDDIDSDTETDETVDEDGDGQGDDDDEDSVEVMIQHTFDLALTKQSSANQVYHPGDNVVFQITVYNQGTLNATDIKVRDYIPDDMVFNPGDNSDFSESGGNIEANIAFLATGKSEELTLTLQIASDFTGDCLINNAEIIDGNNLMSLPDQDDALSNTNDGSTNELATDNDIDDDGPGTPGSEDNPDDEDDYDAHKVDVICDLPPNCASFRVLTVQLDGNGEVTLTASQIDSGSTPTCDNSTISLSIDNDMFTCSDIGSGNIVTLTVTDSNGTTASCTTDVTVEDDLPPTVTCVDVTVDFQNGMPVLDLEDVVVSVSDNCTVIDTSFDLSNIDNDEIECTPMAAEVVATDQSANTGTCSFIITIENDPPEANCVMNASVTLNPSGMGSIPASMINMNSTDDCTPMGSLQFELDISTFDCDDTGPAGVTVTLTVTDEADQSDDCTATVFVTDDTDPEAECQDLTISLDSNGNATITPGQVDDGSSDACGIDDYALDNDTFECIDIGSSNTVILTVTDNNGNTDTCTATITVEDNEAPMVECIPDFTVQLDGDGNVNLSAGTFVMSSSDNCMITNTSIDVGSVDCDDIGSTITVTVTVTDQSNNTATCTTDIEVEDMLPPECTLIADVTFQPFEVIDPIVIFETFDDNCSDTFNTISIIPTFFDCSNLGSQSVTVTVTDESDNSGTCSTTVIIEEQDDPNCLAMNITVFLDGTGMVTITGEDVDGGSTAGCDTIVDYSVTPDFFACNDAQNNPNMVTLTVTDNNGDSSSCTAMVTVLDTISPTITCEADFTVSLDGNGAAVITEGQIIADSGDNCGGFTDGINVFNFTCADKGDNIVTATVTDASGNSATCTTTVTVEDNTAPFCTLMPDLEFIPDVTISFPMVIDTFTDNCAIGSGMMIGDTIFTCDDIGFQTITAMVSDTCGNTSTCETMIEIVDDSTPTCITQDITVSLNISGQYLLTPEEVDDGSSAACGASTTLEVDPNIFDCDDIGDEVVTLTVTSSGGISTQCTATVTIVDDMAPTIVCPGDETVPCETDLSDLSIFGIATVMDNCAANVSLIANNVFDVNACNVGTVERTFIATDDDGNSSSCTQIITISPPNNPITEMDITWPVTPFDAGDCIADPLNIDSGFPVVDTSNAECFRISIDFNDVDPTPTTDGCNDTYERTWTVIDSCQMDNNGVGGIFTFLQIINLNDTVGPIISGPMDTVIFLDPNSTTCDTFINLPATISDCIGGFSGTNDSPYADNNDTADASGTYSGGETLVTITAIDTCGNESTYSYSVTVLDTTAAISSCEKIIASITMNMTADIFIEDALAVITSACMDTTFALSFSNTDPTVDVLTVDCSNLGNSMYTIYLYAGSTLIDSCMNILQVLDGGGFCTTPIAGGIGGTVFTEDDRMVDGVAVNLLGSPFPEAMTDTEGKYAFPIMPFGGDYQVLPVKDTDPMNGISTLDLIGIQKHILGTDRLDSPYKMIAADVNKSGNVTGADLVELRKMILGIYTDFPNNTSWRLIDAGYQFIDPYNPFASDIAEDYEILNFDTDMVIDFVGVKIGDVNNSAQANVNDIPQEDTVEKRFDISVEETLYKKGDIAELIFSMKDIDVIDGVQYSLTIDEAKARILDVESMISTLSSNNLNLDRMGEGKIALSWNKLTFEEELDESMFKVTVLLQEEAWASELVSIDATGLKAETYTDNRIYNVDLRFESDGPNSEAIILYQNQPNPWLVTTEVRYYMPQAGTEVTLNVYDVNGRLMHSQNALSKAGINKFTLDKSNIASTGVLYYELISGNTRLMEKMLLIK